MLCSKRCSNNANPLTSRNAQLRNLLYLGSSDSVFVVKKIFFQSYAAEKRPPEVLFNPGFAKVPVQCSAYTFWINQNLVLGINGCGENRHHRQYVNG
jgi:hypothetical protein